MEEEKDIFVVGKINLNGKKAPFIEIVLDTADARSEGEIILLKQVSNEDDDFYTKKIPREK